ncbi:hypothetical protein JX580_08625 [Thiomicrospira microaerophila]|uniref:hypothetical protein n=1 Tax=Thiomicrospira microaerophila TaxID=406020 RepID=UPI00200FD794|nr:hypothetical protein [Thiomicrospira microaerophila]UQB41730.1 hypothetical protein JX580_08625 [Thiomicrospira microaerophila]
MPGTNHQVESQFMDNLSFSARQAADDMLGHETLKTFLDYKVHGINSYYKNKYANISELEWSKTLRAVTLTKLSYFELNSFFTNEEIDKWIEIAQDAFELPHGNPINLYKIVEHKYSVFTKVLKTAILIKQQRLKKAQAN